MTLPKINDWVKIPSRRTKEVDDTKFTMLPETNYVNVASGLEKIKEEYDNLLIQRANEYAAGTLEKPSFETDEELMEKAKASLDETYAEKKNKEESKADKEIGSLVEQTKKTIDDYNDRVRSVDRKHADKERRAMEALSKNGMTHSTVFDLRKQELKNDHAYDLARLNASNEEQIASLNRRIQEIEEAKRVALQTFEIDYAVKLEDKIAKLIAQRDKMMASSDKKYNKELSEKAKEYIASVEEEDAAYEAEHNDYRGDKKANYEARLAYAVETMKKLPEKDRTRVLNEQGDALEEYLGLYFDKFVKQIGG